MLANGGDVPARGAIDQILSLLLPTYRENLAKAAPPVSSGTAPAATNVSAAPPELVGAWSGEIRTHRANVPLALTITSGGEIEATLGKQGGVKMTNVRLNGNRLTGRMPGDLGIDSPGATPHEVRFQLSRQATN